MKTTLDLARVSGKRGFSDAWPLTISQLRLDTSRVILRKMRDRDSLPSSPYSMHSRPLRNIHNQIHIGVVIIVRSARHLDISVRHPDVLCIYAQVLGSSHDGELNLSVRAEGLVGPFADGTDFFDGSDTIIGNKYLIRR